MIIYPPTAKKKVLVIATAYVEACFRGVLRLARERDWHVVSDAAYTGRFPQGWKGDGIIALIGHHGEIVHRIQETGLPCVAIQTTGDFLPFPSVGPDGKSLGEAAARSIRPPHPQQVLWAPFTNDPFHLQVAAGLQAGLVAQHCHFTEVPPMHRRIGVHWHEDWSAYRHEITTVLQSLPKPATVLAGNHCVAAEIIDVCRELSIAIPEELSLISIGDDLTSGQVRAIPISTLPLNIEHLAGQAAGLLDRLMEGATLLADELLLPASTLTLGASPPGGVEPNPQVFRALEYISQNYFNPGLDVATVADAVRLSRRQLERAFRHETGHTVYTEIIRCRMQEASRLLRGRTRARINEIGELVGFSDIGSFYRAFRRFFGESPAQHRQNAATIEPHAITKQSA